MTDVEALVAIAGLTAITVVTRAFFLLSSREYTLPGWVQRGLRYAPLAALSAVVVPEILMTRGHLIDAWSDARVLAALAAAVTFFWRRSILGTILSGMTVLLALRLGLGW